MVCKNLDPSCNNAIIELQDLRSFLCWQGFLEETPFDSKTPHPWWAVDPYRKIA